MTPVGFKHAIPTSKQPQTHALDHAATEIGKLETVYTVHSVRYDEVNNSYNTNKSIIL